MFHQHRHHHHYIFSHFTVAVAVTKSSQATDQNAVFNLWKSQFIIHTVLGIISALTLSSHKKHFGNICKAPPREFVFLTEFYFHTYFSSSPKWTRRAKPHTTYLHPTPARFLLRNKQGRYLFLVDHFTK